MSGDNGWFLNNELRTPKYVLSNLTGKKGASDWIQGLLFLDYGGAINRGPLNPVSQSSQEVLLSVGAGLRYAIADNLHFRFDYGFQLDRSYLNAPNAGSLGGQPHNRYHVGLELSF